MEPDFQDESIGREDSEELNLVPRIKWTNIVVLALSSLLILGVVYSFWVRNQIDLIEQMPIIEKPKDLVPTKLTEDWNVYASEDYKFEIKYPSKWHYEVENTSYGANSKIGFHPWESGTYEKRGYLFEVTVYPNKTGLTKMLRERITPFNTYVFKGDKAYNLKYTEVSSDGVTEESKAIFEETFYEMIKTFRYLETPAVEKPCIPTGCSNQICTDEEVDTTCEYYKEFACYKDAVCERQKTGQCGWTMSETLKTCLREALGVERIEE